LLYINDLPESTRLTPFLFADDTTLTASGKNLNELIAFVNLEFQKVVEYFRSNKMLLHEKKTKVMIFHPSFSKFNTMQCDIFIDNNNLNSTFNPNLRSKLGCVDHFDNNPTIKFLGINFDPFLSFKNHIAQIASKISHSLFVLRTVKNLLSEDMLKLLYFSTIHCHLIYGIEAWGCAPRAHLNMLILKQKQAVRLITNSKYNQHTEPLFKSTKISPLLDLIEMSKLKFMHSCTFNTLPASFERTWLTVAEHRGNGDHQLRNDDDYYIPLSKNNTTSRLPLINFPLTWNEFPDTSIKLERKKNTFTKKLKSYFLDLIPAIPTCSRANCPSCVPSGT
jgi:hypothetical protein